MTSWSLPRTRHVCVDGLSAGPPSQPDPPRLDLRAARLTAQRVKWAKIAFFASEMGDVKEIVTKFRQSRGHRRMQPRAQGSHCRLACGPNQKLCCKSRRALQMKAPIRNDPRTGGLVEDAGLSNRPGNEDYDAYDRDARQRQSSTSAGHGSQQSAKHPPGRRSYCSGGRGYKLGYGGNGGDIDDGRILHDQS
jgi:hypothetical protein